MLSRFRPPLFNSPLPKARQGPTSKLRAISAKVVLNWYQAHLDQINPSKLEKDPKTRLQEWLQSKGEPLPQYEVTRETGEPHNREYEVSCTVAGMDVFVGVGTGRRRAEQMAAQMALEAIEQ